MPQESFTAEPGYHGHNGPDQSCGHHPCLWMYDLPEMEGKVSHPGQSSAELPHGDCSQQCEMEKGSLVQVIVKRTEGGKCS